MTDKEKIRKEVQRLMNELIQEKEKGYGSDVDDASILELQNVLTFIDSLQEEPVSSIWHNAKEPPEMYRKYFARYSDGRINGSWERHDDGFIPWKDVVKEHNITYWCYVEDLLKL